MMSKPTCAMIIDGSVQLTRSSLQGLMSAFHELYGRPVTHLELPLDIYTETCRLYRGTPGDSDPNFPYFFTIIIGEQKIVVEQATRFKLLAY